MDKSDRVKSGLVSLFEEMLPFTKDFKKKYYEDVFRKGYEKYKDIADEICQECSQISHEDQEAWIEELAAVLPDYANKKILAEKKFVRERLLVDYNMNMAVYVIPILNYNNDAACIALTRRTVELWNGKKMSSMQLSHSSYDQIAGGFKEGFCYITTAVCESRNQPDDCYELTAFRGFRDGYLMKSKEGQKLVEEYYDIAPGIVLRINMEEHAEAVYDRIYQEYLMPCLSLIEEGKCKECQEQYTAMVHELEKKYM